MVLDDLNMILYNMGYDYDSNFIKPHYLGSTKTRLLELCNLSFDDAKEITYARNMVSGCDYTRQGISKIVQYLYDGSFAKYGDDWFNIWIPNTDNKGGNT